MGERLQQPASSSLQLSSFTTPSPPPSLAEVNLVRAVLSPPPCAIAAAAGKVVSDVVSGGRLRAALSRRMAPTMTESCDSDGDDDGGNGSALSPSSPRPAAAGDGDGGGGGGVAVKR
jgi:hypothetical protein